MNTGIAIDAAVFVIIIIILIALSIIRRRKNGNNENSNYPNEMDAKVTDFSNTGICFANISYSEDLLKLTDLLGEDYTEDGTDPGIIQQNISIHALDKDDPFEENNMKSDDNDNSTPINLAIYHINNSYLFNDSDFFLIWKSMIPKLIQTLRLVISSFKFNYFTK